MTETTTTPTSPEDFTPKMRTWLRRLAQHGEMNLPRPPKKLERLAAEGYAVMIPPTAGDDRWHFTLTPQGRTAARELGFMTAGEKPEAPEETEATPVTRPGGPASVMFAFDRDRTIDTSDGPVPLEWVIHLATKTGHQVWAIGNQMLCVEAEIPGVNDMAQLLDIDAKSLDAEQVAGREPEQIRGNAAAKEKRLAALDRLFPFVETKIVVDDIDLSHVAGWDHLTPERFCEDWTGYFLLALD